MDYFSFLAQGDVCIVCFPRCFGCTEILALPFFIHLGAQPSFLFHFCRPASAENMERSQATGQTEKVLWPVGNDRSKQPSLHQPCEKIPATDPGDGSYFSGIHPVSGVDLCIAECFVLRLVRLFRNIQGRTNNHRGQETVQQAYLRRRGSCPALNTIEKAHKG